MHSVGEFRGTRYTISSQKLILKQQNYSQNKRFGFGVDSAAAGVDCPPHCSLDRHARDPLVEELATRVERFFAVST